MVRSGLVLICCLWSRCSSSEVPAEDLPRNPVAKFFDVFLAQDNIELANGVKFVKVNQSSGGESERRSAKGPFVTRLNKFFTTYELQVKPSNFFKKKQDMMDAIQKAMNTLNDLQSEKQETPRGKGGGFGGGGKKAGGAILMMATMMGGTMAALGFGALGMLVMKALTVSSMAFLLSAVIGLRRLFRRPDDDPGFGRISYIPVHAERRKRRSLSHLPYRNYVYK